MIPFFVEELEQVFGWLLEASWQASVLALLVLLVQRLFRSRLNPRWNYLLWLLVVLRLVLPALPESVLSLFQFAPTPPVRFSAPVTQPLFSPVTMHGNGPLVSTAVTSGLHLSFYTLLALAWLAGSLVLLIVTWWANRRFALQMARSVEVSDATLASLLSHAKEELGVSRRVRLVECALIQSPAIMGLFQPTLLLPQNVAQRFSQEELRLIFLHELAHLKRGDITVQWLIAGLQILHWFNPVLWLAFRRMRIDREPATDALVLSRTGEEQKEHYGEMLIKQLEHFNQRHSIPTLVGILEDKDQFKRRFSLIAKFTLGAYGWSLLGACLMIALAVVLLTKGKNIRSDDLKGHVVHDPTAQLSHEVDDQAHEAAVKGDVVALQKIIDAGGDLKTSIDKDGRTLLFYAGSPEVAELLISRGLDVNARDQFDRTPLFGVCVLRTPTTAAAARVLLQHKADPNAADKSGFTPVCYAKDNEMVDVLVEHGADIDITTPDGVNILGASHQFADLSYFQALERHGFSFAPKTENASSLLVKASWNRQLPVMKWLLDRGVDPNVRGLWFKDKNGTNYMLPIQAAAIRGASDVITLLLEHGAKADGAMITALYNRRSEVAKIFWNSGVRGISELSYALSQGAKVADVEKYLKEGTPADPPEDSRLTPLGMAAQSGQMDIVQLLVEHGADVNKGGLMESDYPIYSMTPLMMAASEGQDEIVVYLLAHGAKPTARILDQAVSNSTPYPNQRSQDHFEKTVQILIDAGALNGANDEEKGQVLINAILTRQGPGNTTVLKMLLSSGLSPELAVKNLMTGEAKSVIAICREHYDNPLLPENYKKEFKPFLDMLDEALKAKGVKADSTSEKPAAATEDQITIESRVFSADRDALQKLISVSDDKLSAATKKTFGSLLKNKQWGLVGVLDDKGLIELLQTIDATKDIYLLSAPKVTAKQGVRARIEVVREFYYPTAYDPKPSEPGAFVPTKFETKNVGITVDATSRFDSSKNAIDLQASIELCDFAGWQRIKDGRYFAPAERVDVDMKFKIARPVFNERSFKATVGFPAGHTLIMRLSDGSHLEKPLESSKEFEFVLLTATVVKAEGK